jgi:hypothetical protein
MRGSHKQPLNIQRERKHESGTKPCTASRMLTGAPHEPEKIVLEVKADRPHRTMAITPMPLQRQGFARARCCATFSGAAPAELLRY